MRRFLHRSPTNPRWAIWGDGDRENRWENGPKPRKPGFWPRRGFEQHDVLMPWLKCDMRFDSIRSDPRYQELLRGLRMD